ncbi:hypothetical protein AXF42_Ash002078 [Apostasia shenzhenica]|uniref:Uncharacterized protein n=1 Tax=Apostasia shenzhenica TaxID=1088818 RepID=A0A2I0AMR7_9ASPA|nr:hypothetical protein AXF42_Ash002078 [Apostasia shenzhenica]
MTRNKNIQAKSTTKKSFAFLTITSRCFPCQMRSLFDEISSILPKEIIEILHNVGMTHFLRIPSYKANVSIISVVLSRWDEAVGGFKIGHHVIPFNPEVISSLIGMPNHGTSFNWVTTYPNLSIRIRDIKDTLKSTVNSTYRDPQQIASLIIKFILSALFFLKNNYSVHPTLIECAENFHLVSTINWYKSIYDFLRPFLLPLSQKLRTQKKSTPRSTAGYIDGFCLLIMFAFLKNINIRTPAYPDEVPKIFRWSSDLLWYLDEAKNSIRSIEVGEMQTHCTQDNLHQYLEISIRPSVQELNLTKGKKVTEDF